MRMRRRLLVAAVLILGAAGSAGVFLARHISTRPPAPPDYEDDAAWLCRPGRTDACSSPTTATIFEAGDRKRVETYSPDPTAPIDCFYLYPTVSRVRAAYAPIAATGEETKAARRQLAPFGTVCRTFAPLYRQVTLPGLPLLFGGDPEHVNLRVPVADAIAAWHHYLAHDNHGRGVVLIGHSQGSRVLARMIAAEIDGKPFQAKLISAILPGADIDVPAGAAVGGTFEHIPLCARGGGTGCVIAYSAFPADRPVPADARFGFSKTPGMRDACVDPAALAGAAHLDALLPLDETMKAKLGTDFAALPGLLTAHCTSDRPYAVLAVGADPNDPAHDKADAMIARLAQYQPAAGLHVLDLNLALGTLVDLVRRQTASYGRH